MKDWLGEAGCSKQDNKNCIRGCWGNHPGWELFEDGGDLANSYRGRSSRIAATIAFTPVLMLCSGGGAKEGL